jgi:hypothetical protein
MGESYREKRILKSPDDGRILTHERSCRMGDPAARQNVSQSRQVFFRPSDAVI